MDISHNTTSSKHHQTYQRIVDSGMSLLTLEMLMAMVMKILQLEHLLLVLFLCTTVMRTSSLVSIKLHYCFKLIFQSQPILDHYQHIKAEEFDLTSGSGFGFSVAKQSMDANEKGVINLAVGAPFESSVIVMKTRRVVSFDPEIRLKKPRHIDPQQSSKRSVNCKYDPHRLLYFIDFMVEYDISLNNLNIEDELSITKLTMQAELTQLDSRAKLGSKLEPVRVLNKRKKLNFQINSAGDNFVTKNLKDLKMTMKFIFSLGCEGDPAGCPLFSPFEGLFT